MEETKHGPSGKDHAFVVGDITESSRRLLHAIPPTSAIGLAILDHKLRYQAIDACLAGINGMPAQAHLGVHVSDLFGDLSRKIAEPSYQRVLSRAELAHFEVKNAVLPKRADSRYWGLNTNFPIRDRTGAVREIGIIVVDVSEQRRLELFLSEVIADPRHLHKRESLELIRELHDAMDEYHATLALTLKYLFSRSRHVSASDEPLGESIARLDQRLLNISAFVSVIARHFQIDR